VSTLHRVILPSTMKRRYSIAFFVNINGDCVVEPLDSCHSMDDDDQKKYPPITAKEHLMAKHLASMGDDDGQEVEEEALLREEL
jgi:isopenicillin N synthase-like dioxygenase